MNKRECNRLKCKNTSCYRYSNEYGYICIGCINELIELGFNIDIKVFMNTPKIEEISNILRDKARRRYFCKFPFIKGDK